MPGWGSRWSARRGLAPGTPLGIGICSALTRAAREGRARGGCRRPLGQSHFHTIEGRRLPAGTAAVPGPLCPALAPGWGIAAAWPSGSTGHPAPQGAPVSGAGPGGSGTCPMLSTPQRRGHVTSGARCTPLGRGHSDTGPLPCVDAAARPWGNVVLLLHRSHFCVHPCWQGPSSGKESSGSSRGSSPGQGQRCLVPWGMARAVLCLLWLLPSRNARSGAPIETPRQVPSAIKAELHPPGKPEPAAGIRFISGQPTPGDSWQPPPVWG